MMAATRGGMSARRFAWMLRARGPDIAGWPQRERDGAMALLRQDKAAQELLAEALTAEDAPALDAAALARVMCPVRAALAPLTPLMRGLRWGAIAGCLLAGLYLGALSAQGEVVADVLASMHPSMPAMVLAALEP